MTGNCMRKTDSETDKERERGRESDRYRQTEKNETYRGAD